MPATHSHILNILQCIDLEEKEQVKRYSLDQQHTLRTLKAEGLALHPITVTRKNFGYADYPEISFKLTFPAETGQFKDGAAIECFYSGQEPVKGILINLEGKMGEFRLFAPDFPDWIEDPGVGIKLAPDQRTTSTPYDSALVRIIGGIAAGLILKTPEGLGVRPTPDLVRQAVFNSLGARVLDARVLELFGGTGALSLECLSRGAAHAICVELSRKHGRFIEQNFEATKIVREKFQLRLQDVFTALPQLCAAGSQFDLVLADPPFGEKNVGHRSTSLSQSLLDDEDVPRLLAPGGLFILGHARRDTVTITAGWTERKEMRHGDSMMRFLMREA